MLSQLEQLGRNVGLYNDNKLTICNKTLRQTENIKKEMCKHFQRKQAQNHVRSQPKNCRLPRHYNGLKDWRTLENTLQ